MKKNTASQKKVISGLTSSKQKLFNEKPVRKLGMFFYIRSHEDLQKVFDFVKSVRKNDLEVTPLVYFDGKLLPPKDDPALFWIDKSDFNFFGKKKKALAERLRLLRFDLFISFVTEENKKCSAVIGRIQAGLKAGPKRKNIIQQVDISLAMTEEKIDYNSFYKQLQFYISQLKISIKE